MTYCIKLSSMIIPVCCIQIRRKPAFVQVLQENLTQYMEPENLQLFQIPQPTMCGRARKTAITQHSTNKEPFNVLWVSFAAIQVA